jgi:hypothetical protein
MATKKCYKCKEVIDISSFHKDSRSKDGHCSKCKFCFKIYDAANKERRSVYYKQYRALNYERRQNDNMKYYIANKDRVLQYQTEYYKSNRCIVRKKQSVYYKKNSCVICKNVKRYKTTHKRQRNLRERERLKTDMQYKMAKRLRSRLRCAVKGDRSSSLAVEYLGCSIDSFIQHIESLFIDGMNWDNWSYEGWHLDHIKPIASFDLTIDSQIREACHYTNLRPLWAKENLQKGCKSLEEYEGNMGKIDG